MSPILALPFWHLVTGNLWLMWNSPAMQPMSCYSWQHNQILRKERSQWFWYKQMECLNGTRSNMLILYVQCRTVLFRTSIVAPGNDRSARTDLNDQLRFPTDITTTTTLRHDLVLWSATEKLVLIVELMVPLEEWIKKENERTKVIMCWTFDRTLRLLWLCETFNPTAPERHQSHIS